MAASWVANCAREIKLVLRSSRTFADWAQRRFGNGLHIVVPGTPAELTTADFRQGPGSWSSAAGQSSKDDGCPRWGSGSATTPPILPEVRATVISSIGVDDFLPETGGRQTDFRLARGTGVKLTTTTIGG